MTEVTVHTFKDHDLRGGTLVVSVPHGSVGNILLTDFLLEHNGMDHFAAFDADAFPPVAMLRRGKARFPLRVHANAEKRIAVLRSEFSPRAQDVRPIVRAILDWADGHGVKRVIALDAVRVTEAQESDGGGPPPVFFAACRDASRDRAEKEGMELFEHGAIAGVPGRLLLDGRLRDVDVLVLLAAVRDGMDDARSVTTLGRALAPLTPQLDIDEQALGERVKEIQATVTRLQEQAREAMRGMADEDEGQGGRAEAPSMYR